MYIVIHGLQSSAVALVVDVPLDLPSLMSMQPPLAVGEHIVFTACRQYPSEGSGEWRAIDVQREGGVEAPLADMPEYLVDASAPITTRAPVPAGIDFEQETINWLADMEISEVSSAFMILLCK